MPLQRRPQQRTPNLSFDLEIVTQVKMVRLFELNIKSKYNGQFTLYKVLLFYNVGLKDILPMRYIYVMRTIMFWTLCGLYVHKMWVDSNRIIFG